MKKESEKLTLEAVDKEKESMRPSGEYETSILHTPYRLISLMLKIIFGRADGKKFKIGWVLVIFFVAT